MDTRKAVKTYHRNLAIVLAIIVAIFAAIPLVVDKPYIINILDVYKRQGYLWV